MSILGVQIDVDHIVENRRSGARVVQTSSDKDGMATLDVPVGIRLVARASTFDRTNSVRVELEPFTAGETREFLLEMKTRPDVEVEGLVVSHEDESPIEGARLYVDTTGFLLLGGPPAPFNTADEPVITTNESGRFKMMVRSWTIARTTVAAEGWSPVVLALLDDGKPIERFGPIPTETGGDDQWSHRCTESREDDSRRTSKCA